MNISMHFEGFPEKIIQEALNQGLAKTKAEALRLALLELNQKYGLVASELEQRELEMDIAEFDRMERALKAGSTKIRKAKSVDELFT
ncbi:MAG TPA: hypothetical protein VI874_05540 [Candidatus Norongarragalinales archaeon]|nr:hypothetical protein [Candidatus Norongarragalinales archaeon]